MPIKPFLTGCVAMLILSATPTSAAPPDSRTTSSNPPAALLPLQESASPDNTMPHRKVKKRTEGFFRPVASRPASPVRCGAPTATITLKGTMYSYDDSPTGIYSFTTTSAELTEIATNDNLSGEYGATIISDGAEFFNVMPGNKAYRWDTSSWTETASGQGEMIVSTTMATDPQTGKVYGCTWPATVSGIPLESEYHLSIIDTEEYVRKSTVGVLAKSMTAMFFTTDGTLYGLSWDGTLYKINKTTALLTEMGNTGIDLSYGGSAVVDSKSGKAYVAANGDTVGLYELDLATTTGTLLYEYDEDVVFYAIWTEAPEVAAGVPGKAQSFEVSAPMGTTTVTITALSPDKTHGGQAGSGTLTYNIMCDGTSIKSGETTWGGQVNYSATVAQGEHSFAIVFSNNEGEGQASAQSLWVGNDHPVAPSGVKLEHADGANVISWNASTTGFHGGYVNPEAVTYSVRRLNDGSMVATNISGTSYTDRIPATEQPEFYTYEVTATHAGLTSEAVKTNYVVVGAVYYNGFDSQADFDLMDVRTLSASAPLWQWNLRHQAASVSYNEDAAVESWMFSAPLELEKDRVYDLSFFAWGSHEEYQERLSVYITTETDLKTLIQNTTPFIDRMLINWEKDAATAKKAAFTCPASGTYRIAFRGCSPRDLGTVFVDDVMLSAQPLRAVPSAPVLTAERNGELGVNITIKAPSTNTDGNTLTSLTSIVLSRDGQALKTFDAPAPGATLTFAETLPAGGTYVYTAVATDANGRSEAATTTVVANEIGRPVAPQSLSAKETETPGEVTLSWNAPLVDVLGQPLAGTAVTYAIYPADSDEAIAEGLTSKSHTFTAVGQGKQAFVSFRVAASTKAGQGGFSRASAMIAAGTPDSAPYTESMADTEFTHLWMAKDNGEDARWQIIGASQTPAATPQDGDGGMLAFSGDFLEESASITTGKIDVGSGDNPVLTLWYFAQNSKAGKDELGVAVGVDGEFKTLARFSMRDEEKDGWTKRTISLAGYAGKCIQLRLTGYSFMTDNFMLVDNIEITNIGHDFAATSLIMPASVGVGREFTIEAGVTNNGSHASADYAVKLFRNGELVATSRGIELMPGQTDAVRFTEKTDPTWAKTAEYHFEVSSENDDVATNNISEKKSIAIVTNTFATVTGLAAEWVDNSHKAVNITWQKPDASTAKGAYTDDFEHLESFEINPACDWTFVDVDDDDTFGPSTVNFPGANKPMAFVAFDATRGNLTYAAHSGNLYLASYCAQNKPTDDWMISPLLTGEAQQISFFARSYSDTYGLEEFEILVSGEGAKTTDFKTLKAVRNVPTDWTEFTADLPAGSRYFAIRHTSDRVFALFIDDVTYEPAVSPVGDDHILGYNVYRDGVALNSTPVADRAFTDSDSPAATSIYKVSVVYDRGESNLSPGVAPGQSGLDGIAEGSVLVQGLKGAIRISASEETDIRISAADGRTIFSATTASTTVDVPSGIYVVEAAGTVAKVIVR